ncbi:MAG: ATP-binding protein [Anaerolineae bacterium]|nr:ATP-binding protein [Anaerolineae bacterium]
MFSALRLRLTLLYVIAASLLIVFIGLGSYFGLRWYFVAVTDEALKHKLAHEYEAQGLAVPPELEQADKSWYERKGKLIQPVYSDSERTRQDENNAEEYYAADIAGIFVLPLNEQGKLVFDPNVIPVVFLPDLDAGYSALRQGSDSRTVTLSNGMRARLFSYKLQLAQNEQSALSAVAVLQVGKNIQSQDEILQFLLVATLGLGAATALSVGSVSWYLAGKSILPAEQAWAKQQIFIANASHELRAPLALIRASAEVVKSETDTQNEFAHMALQDVLHEADHMTRMIEDLLTLSRLDADKIKLSLAATALLPIFQDIGRKMNRLAHEKQLVFEVADTSLVVIADPQRLQEVLTIVLDNAFKHTPAAGKVTLSAKPLRSIGGGQVQIEVTDTGCGIAAEHLPHVFERFYRVDSSRVTTNKGTGLGLAIAKSLVEAMAGSIILRSELNKGTHVRITLPIN